VQTTPKIRNIRCVKWIVLAGVLLVPLVSRAENNCPWLNEATASGILNSPVDLKVQTAEDDGGSCVFSAHGRSSIDSLRITVSDVKDTSKSLIFYQSQCTSPRAPLNAIGNEAELCSVDVDHSRREQVVGRVRNKIFVVSINSGTNNDSTASRKLLQEKVVGIAEQVAGFLF
jgi:hypothetical protein